MKEQPFFDPKEHWHLQKSIPITLVIALCVQFIGFIIYASKLDARVEYLEKNQLEIRQDVNFLEKENGQRKIEVAEILVRLENLTKIAEEIRDEIKRN